MDKRQDKTIKSEGIQIEATIKSHCCLICGPGRSEKMSFKRALASEGLGGEGTG